MQRFKTRTSTRRESQDNEYIEDVAVEDSEESVSDDQPLLSGITKVFAPSTSGHTINEDAIPLKALLLDDESQAVTIVNESIEESALVDVDDEVVDTDDDSPSSLVIANNGHHDTDNDEYIELQEMPPPSAPQGKLVLKDDGDDADGSVGKTHVPQDAWNTPVPDKEEQNEDTSEEAEEIRESVEYHEDYEQVTQHSSENSAVQDTPLEAERTDEYGNLLDEEGHPIIKHAFPDSWILQPDQGDGITRFETEDGPVRFIMELGYNYPNPPNVHKLVMDCYLKHIPTTHRISSGCEFFVDNGVWRLELETEIVNVLKRMDVALEFEDVTGETLWNASKDITIKNLNRAMDIFRDCELDESPIRWFLSKDAVYNPKDNIFRLSSGVEVENNTKQILIPDGMELVKSDVTVNIPLPSNTEFKNDNEFMICEGSDLVDQGTRHLDSEGCYIKDILSTFVIIDDAELEDQGTRHLRNKDSVLEDQGTRHLICEEGETVDIVRGHHIPDGAVVEDITRGFLLFDDADKVDIKRHYLALDQDIDRTPADWSLSNFDNELVHLTEFDRVETDIKLVLSPSKFKLNQIEVDDEMLEGEDDDD